MNYPDRNDLYFGKFTDGNPATGIPSSIDSAADMNAVYDELLNVINAAGMTPNSAKQDQLLASLKTLFIEPGEFGLGGNAVDVSDSSFHDLRVSGSYCGNNMREAPLESADWFYFRVTKYNDDYQMIEAFQLTHSDRRSFKKFYQNGNWSDWVEVMTQTTQEQLVESLKTMFIEPGKFGLGGDAVDVSETSFHALRVTGSYYGRNMSEAPLDSTDGFYFRVTKSTDDYQLIEAFQLDNSDRRAFKKFYQNGNWSDWVEVMTQTTQDQLVESLRSMFIEPGEFGLGGDAVDVSDSSFHDPRATGSYCGNNMLEAPLESADWFYFRVTKYTDDNQMIEAFQLDNSDRRAFKKFYQNGNWSDWVEEITQVNQGTVVYSATGSANEIVLTSPLTRPKVASLSSYDKFCFVVNENNTDSVVNLTIDGISASIKGLTAANQLLKGTLATVTYLDDGFWLTAQINPHTGNDVKDIAKVITDSLDRVEFGEIVFDGATLKRADHPVFWAKVQTSSNLIDQASKDAEAERYAGFYGTGDGETTFTIPTLGGEFIRGYDNGRGVDAGREFASYQEDALKEHRHHITTRDAFSTSILTINDSSGDGIVSSDNLYDANSNARVNRYMTQFTGGVETRPRSIAYFFKTRT